MQHHERLNFVSLGSGLEEMERYSFLFNGAQKNLVPRRAPVSYLIARVLQLSKQLVTASQIVGHSCTLSCCA
jgi:hypothetical protein